MPNPDPVTFLSDSDGDMELEVAKEGHVDGHGIEDNELHLTDDNSDATTLDLPGTRRGVEVFSGSGNLSSALLRRGLVMDQVDLAISPSHDLTQDSVVESLCAKALSGRWCYAHFAPPCNTYSVARFPRILRTEPWANVAPGLWAP